MSTTYRSRFTHEVVTLIADNGTEATFTTGDGTEYETFTTDSRTFHRAYAPHVVDLGS